MNARERAKLQFRAEIRGRASAWRESAVAMGIPAVECDVMILEALEKQIMQLGRELPRDDEDEH